MCEVRGRKVLRVGARWAEPEIMRYRSRQILDAAIARADLIQVVCGSAVSAFSVRRSKKPIFVQVATTLRCEREKGGVAAQQGIVGRMMTRLCVPLERRALLRADGVFVENAWMRDWLDRELPVGKVHFAPPGTDTLFFHPNSEVTRDRLLFVGRLGDPRKNIRMLLEAYRTIRATLSNAPCLVMAGGMKPTDSDMKYIAESRLMPFVEVVSNPDRSALAALYRRCRVFMLASNEEGFGIVLVEAMASGAPVVSTDCGGPRSIIEEGENGFLVPVGDAAALAERVVRLLRDDALRESMGRKALSRAQSAFSLAVCGSRFATVYKTTMDRLASG